MALKMRNYLMTNRMNNLMSSVFTEINAHLRGKTALIMPNLNS